MRRSKCSNGSCCSIRGAARKLFLEAIPQYVDEYLDALRAYAAASEGTTPRIGARICDPELHPDAIQLDPDLRPDDEPRWRLSAARIAIFIWNYIVRYDAAIAGDLETEEDGQRTRWNAR